MLSIIKVLEKNSNKRIKWRTSHNIKVVETTIKKLDK